MGYDNRNATIQSHPDTGDVKVLTGIDLSDFEVGTQVILVDLKLLQTVLMMVVGMDKVATDSKISESLIETLCLDKTTEAGIAKFSLSYLVELIGKEDDELDQLEKNQKEGLAKLFKVAFN